MCYKPRQPKQLRLVPPLELEKNQAPDVNRRTGSGGQLVWVSRHLGNADRSLAFRIGRRTAGDDPQLNIKGRRKRAAISAFRELRGSSARARTGDVESKSVAE